MPDRSVEQRGFWFGAEVEGVLKATRPFTVIVRTPPADARAVLACDGQPVQHAFLTEEFEDWDWLGNLLAVFTGPVTIGCHANDVDRLKLIKVFDPRLRVIVRYWDEQVAELLSPVDEISVGGPFDLLTFQVGDGVRTTPEDYEDDKA